MKFKVIPHFEQIFPEEQKLNVLEYLIKIPKEALLKSIGFCNTYPLPNYYNFFSNPKIAKEVKFRISLFQEPLDDSNEIEIITPYSYLRLSEIILSNIELFTEIGDPTVDSELCLFKAFLVLNSRFSEYEHDFDNNASFDSFKNFIMLQNFQLSEISLFENEIYELNKLVYSTIYKVESLLKFLSTKDLTSVKNSFIASFNVKDEGDLRYQMKYLFAILLLAKSTNKYIFSFENFNSPLIKNISSVKIKEDEDFTDIKKTPIYFIDNNRFSIINFFFVVDLFYRSAKFRLKEILEAQNSDIANVFSFYSKNFSEDFLMKNLLDEIFDKKYLRKKKSFEIEQKNEPDYYVNYNNTIFLFENKDILINKSIKATTNIETLLDFLRKKLFQNQNKKVGIQQLIFSIEKIYKREFLFDDDINYNKRIEIFPIFIIHDRIFQSTGINYRLNEWFRDELNKRGIVSSERIKIHGLTLFDIDTLICWNKSIKNKFKLMREIVEKHTKSMEEKQSKYYKNPIYITDYLMRVLKPISQRSTPFFLRTEDFMHQFKDLIKK